MENKKFTIKEISYLNYSKVCFYSITKSDTTESEFENFVNLFQTTNKIEIQQMLLHIKNIGKEGAFDRHFGYASKKSDNVASLPGKLYIGNKLRLYVLKLNENIVILGNGGIKTSKTYNTDNKLNECVEDLKKIDFELNILIKKQKTFLEGKNIRGQKTIKI